MEAGPHTGQQFGAYVLHGLIGRGGMGIVYRAEHEHLGRTVALKLLTPELAASSGFRERFLRESRLAASLDHPNVVPVYDAGEVSGTLFIAMRFVHGTDLSARLREEKELEPKETLGLLSQAGAALDAAHELGLVHRDVKPANVMIEGKRCYLTDFGLTKKVSDDAGLTAAGQFLGTVDYVAPEQIEGTNIDGRADVYALGCVLHQCLTGSRPFPRDSEIAVIYAQLKEPPPRPTDLKPELPPAIDDVVLRAMAKLPDERYDTCAQMMAAAYKALADYDMAMRPTGVRKVVKMPEPEPSTASPPGSTGGTGATGSMGPSDSTDSTDSTGAMPPLAPPSQPPPSPDDLHVYGQQRPRPRWVLPAALAALALVVLVVVIAASGGGGSGGGGSSGGGPSQPHVVGRPLEVGKSPIGVVSGTGVLWVANRGDGTVSRVPTAAGAPRTDIKVGSAPFGVARSPDTVWIANSGSDSVSRIDVKTGRVSAEVPVGHTPYFASADANSVFVSNGGESSVSVLDARTGQLVGSKITVGRFPRGIVAGGTAVWVAIKGENTVQRIVNGRVVKTIPVGANPVGVALGGNALWVTNKDDGTVSRIDLAGGGSKATTIQVGSQPEGIAVGDGVMWVAVGGANEVTRLDLATGKPVGKPVPVPDQPVGITVASDGLVWVTSNNGNALRKIQP